MPLVNEHRFAFNPWQISLAEAVRITGGLLDVQADASPLLSYRQEPPQLAETLRVEWSKFEGPIAPIIYSVSFSDPSGYLLATDFQMYNIYNKDVLFAPMRSPSRSRSLQIL